MKISEYHPPPPLGIKVTWLEKRFDKGPKVKLSFSRIFVRNTTRVSSSYGPDSFVEHNLGPNRLQMVSAEDKSRQLTARIEANVYGTVTPMPYFFSHVNNLSFL